MKMTLTADRVYRKLQLNAHGVYEQVPVDVKVFEAAQGVGARMEPKLTALPQDVSLVSLAISMARIADSLETLERVGYHRYKRERRSLWKKLTEKEDAGSH